MSDRSIYQRPMGESFFDGAAAEAREKTIAKRQRGAARKQAGETLEGYLARAHHQYLAQRVGYLTKLHVQTVGHPMALRYAGPSDADYMGHILIEHDTRPTPVLFDAKATHEATFRAPRNPKDWKTFQRQLRSLLQFSEQPHTLAFLLVVDTALGWGWYLAGPVLRQLQEDREVKLRTIVRGPERVLHHHVPAFALRDTVAIARGIPYIDWRAGLPELCAWLDTQPATWRTR